MFDTEVCDCHMLSFTPDPKFCIIIHLPSFWVVFQISQLPYPPLMLHIVIYMVLLSRVRQAPPSFIPELNGGGKALPSLKTPFSFLAIVNSSTIFPPVKAEYLSDCLRYFLVNNKISLSGEITGKYSSAVVFTPGTGTGSNGTGWLSILS